MITSRNKSRERERDRQTDRQTERQTETGRQRERERERDLRPCYCLKQSGLLHDMIAGVLNGWRQ